MFLFQKAIDILKVRKSDAVKVIAIMILCHLLNTVMQQLLYFFGLSDIAFINLVTFPVSLLLTFISIVLSLGIERLLVFSQQPCHAIGEVFRAGYKYFWRVFGVLALLVGFCVAQIICIVIIFNMILGLEPIDGIYYSIFFAVISLLLIKYMYFVPAQIIVYNRKISESIKNVKYYRSREINLFVLLCLFVHVLMQGAFYMRHYFMVRGSVLYIVSTACQTVIVVPTTFFLSLVAVLYVYRQFCSEQADSLQKPVGLE